MNEIVKKLTLLVLSCHRVKIPQKWIGSSLAIGFDSGEIPKRTKSEEEIRDSAIVRIFDWGRSELNDSILMKDLSESQVKDREFFWNEYKNGINSISWIVTQKYFNRYCCLSWKYITFLVYDHDILSDDDLMCKVTVPLEETKVRKCPLLTKRGHDGGSLSYSIKWKPLCESSRLKGVWRVKIYEGSRLPNFDGPFIFCNGTHSDPYVVIRPQPSSCDTPTFPFEQATTVKHNDADPVWNEEFSIPVSKLGDKALREVLDSAGVICNEHLLSPSKAEWENRVKASII